jgi:hypothetical protein
VLCAFDHTYFLQSGDEDDGFHQVGFFSPFSLLSLTLLSFQTCMVPHYRLNIEAWLQETKDRGLLAVDDLEQGANFECAACPPFLPFFRSTALTRISRTGDIARSLPSSARSLGTHLSGMLQASHSRYLDPSCARPYPLSLALHGADEHSLLSKPHTRFKSERGRGIRLTSSSLPPPWLSRELCSSPSGLMG